MKNGRENRTNGNEEKGKEEDQKALSGFQCEAKQGTRDASPKFLGNQVLPLKLQLERFPADKATVGMRFSCAGHTLR